MQSKPCTKCKVEKTLDQYNKSTNGCLYGVHSICKNCMVISRREKTLIKNQGKYCEYPVPKHKKCKTCGIEKENTEEYFRWSSRAVNKKRNLKKIEEIHPHSRFQNECRACEAQQQRKRHSTPEGKLISKKWKQNNKHKTRAMWIKYREKNKEILKEKSRKRYYDNHKKYLDIAKKYREKYPERNRERSKAYYWKNKDAVNKRASEWRKRVRYSVSRKQKDPIYKLKCECRGRINWLTRRRSTVSNYNKTCPQTEKIIGCTVAFYYSHIEKQFVENMTWDNYGEWQVDHIIPLATAKTKEHVLALNKWSNLQPLWLSDNIKKGTKVPESSLYDYYINEISE